MFSIDILTKRWYQIIWDWLFLNALLSSNFYGMNILRQVLVKPKNAIGRQYRKMFSMNNVSICYQWCCLWQSILYFHLNNPIPYMLHIHVNPEKFPWSPYSTNRQYNDQIFIYQTHIKSKNSRQTEKLSINTSHIVIYSNITRSSIYNER